MLHDAAISSYHTAVVEDWTEMVPENFLIEKEEKDGWYWLTLDAGDLKKNI